MNTNKLQVLISGQWSTIRQGNLQYLMGYMDAMANQSPRLAHRIISKNAQVIESIEEKTEVYIGQIAGFPTPEQYEVAAKRALEKAGAIRTRMNKP